MGFIGVIAILIFIILVLYLWKKFLEWFNRVLPKDKVREEAKNKRKEERKKIKQNYKDYWDAKNEAEENSEKERFLKNITGFNLVGEDSNAHRFGKHLRKE